MIRTMFTIGILTFASSLASAADGFTFGTSFKDAFSTAKDEKKMVMILIVDDSKMSGRLETELPANAKFGKVVMKNFVPVKGKFDVDTLDLVKDAKLQAPSSVYAFTADREFIGSIAMPRTTDLVVPWAEGILEVKAGLDALAKVDKSNPSGTLAALKKIGKIPSRKGAVIFGEYAENKKQSDEIRKFAVEQLVKQRDGMEKVNSLFADGSAVVRNAASAALKGQGLKAVPALLKGLEESSPEVRAASAALLKPLVTDAKLARDSAFWKSGNDADRASAIDALSRWWKVNGPVAYNFDWSN